MAAAAAAAVGPGGRAAGSAGPPLRRGRGRRRHEAGPAEDEPAPAGPARRSGQREGPGRPLCHSRPSPAGEPGPPPPPRAQRDFIFRAPITLAKHGEVHEEYKSHLQKLRDEKWQEERNPEDLIHRLRVEDAEAERRRTDDQKKEESTMAKGTQGRLPECLSDSENEEPFQGRPVYRSAFVSKGSAYSLALLAGNFSSQVERSQSCNDTLGNRSKSRQRSAPVRTKANPLAGAPAPLVGVLSSTQNNRCLSAPDLTAEKRLTSHPGSSFPPLSQKQERSISPESNDSISEELNHFKPIVCSPCTPPKQLPDGRVLSPLLIKSTPRNLTRSLQKPTTYEASPWILKKWEQILQERQIKRTLSKATLTSSAPEPGEDPPAPNMPVVLAREPLPVSSDGSLPDPLSPAHPAKLGSSGNSRRGPEASALLARPAEKPPNGGVSKLSDAKPASRPAGSCLRLDAKTIARKVVRVSSAFAENNGTLGAPAEGKLRRRWGEGELCHFPNGLRLERGLGEDAPSLRRGQKRPCKTKHLDPSIKRPRPAAGRKGPTAADPLRRKRRRQRSGAQPRLPQEEADRRLALQLQRQFEREDRTMERQKGRAEQYFLRSKNTTTAK
ncbi:E3 ubiquitin-protein ligase RNF169 [Candoia aspera]|uniref:E3 ubiquitin-protein ligase RNF169 n=1 Tax=Candoia aspera TaxID=51853 RepID=UPI002FD842A5